MLISKNLLNILFYSIVAAAVAAALMYYKQHTILRQQIIAHKHEVKLLKQDCNSRLSEMDAYINSLSSRVKHLSLDNRRLSSTGYRLSQQLEENTGEVDNQPKMTEYKKLQAERSNLDQHIISKYDAFINQQKSFMQLSAECNFGKSKELKCVDYAKAAESLESVALQIKFLKTKREVLNSQIARAESGL